MAHSHEVDNAAIVQDHLSMPCAQREREALGIEPAPPPPESHVDITTPSRQDFFNPIVGSTSAPVRTDDRQSLSNLVSNHSRRIS